MTETAQSIVNRKHTLIGYYRLKLSSGPAPGMLGAVACGRTAHAWILPVSALRLQLLREMLFFHLMSSD